MTPAGRTSGFTLIELVLVIVLLAIFAAVAMPRMGGMQDRRLQSEAEAVQSLLSIAAQRELTAAEPLAIVYRHGSESRGTGRATLSVQVRRVQAGTVGSGGAGGAPMAAWVNDPLITPVELSLLELRSAAADGQRLSSGSGGGGGSGGGWRIVFSQTEPRPAVEIVLSARAPATPDRQWIIELQPQSPAAVLSDGTRAGGGPVDTGLPAPIDLNAIGRGFEPW